MDGRVARIAGVAAVGLALTSCSDPPGPAPAMPAPDIPEDAIAYDELRSTAQRPFPFTDDCAQISPEVAQQAGLAGEMETLDDALLDGCVLDAGADQPFGWLGVHGVRPSNDPDDDTAGESAFEGEWRGGSWTQGHFERSILLDRYYAVTTFDGENGSASCNVVVDTGSQRALEFIGYLEEEAGRAKHAEIFDDQYSSEPSDRDALETFVSEHCPAVREAAEVLLTEAIDPGGGSLATELK
ncbi:hypothetical protein H0B56_18535 [Haloechinothrix sp. YIM 98757]|uniref:Uncharacterized protein n=1 Tax=Haloechinothrix aidingensis TaxID=2752311 RepID=A0A838AE16_9PSEU|nr:hypothetical protein [Haloechinothrix aidingensis]MBA0127546.1 hypothetical protein [Haloechinothrix aidingensis]